MVNKLKTELWEGRSIQTGFSGLTTAEASRLALRVFGLLAFGIGVGSIALAIAGAASGSIVLLSIPFLISAIGVALYSLDQGDYENPEELERFRRNADKMDLNQVAQTYGWVNIFRWGILTPDSFQQKYRKAVEGRDVISIIKYYEKVLSFTRQVPFRYKYLIPPPREWRNRWQNERQNLTFEQIITTYPLEKLDAYQILEVSELNRLKELKRDYDAIKRIYDEKAAIAEAEFQRNTAPFRQTYDEACARANQLYQNNQAVRDLQGFDLRYIRERQIVHDRLTQRKNAARAPFNVIFGELTNQGRIPYERLTATQQVSYNQVKAEWQVIENRLDHEAQGQVNEIDQRCIQERERLNSEEIRAKEERQATIQSATNVYHESIAGHIRTKEEQLTPDKNRFAASVNDLNQRYRAFLRTVGQ
jgi:hypothetical protein